jgi:arylsulfatase A-like enzyme
LVDRTQLFDLQSDPHELRNLAAQPEHAAKVAELMALLVQEQKRYGDAAPLQVADPQPAEWTPPRAKPDSPPAKVRAKRKS